MKTLIATLLAACAALAGTTATADPIVVAGSSYSIYIADEGASGQAVNEIVLTGQFDGSAEGFTVGGQNFVLTETQADLGGGRHHIQLLLSSDSDMSHFVLDGAGGFFYGLGFDGNGLDFYGPVYLDQAIYRSYTTQGVFFNDHLASDYRDDYFSGAWSGTFAAPNEPFVVSGAGAHDIRALRLDFFVQELPEPGSLALVTLALLGAASTARRRLTLG